MTPIHKLALIIPFEFPLIELSLGRVNELISDTLAEYLLTKGQPVKPEPMLEPLYTKLSESIMALNKPEYDFIAGVYSRSPSNVTVVYKDGTFEIEFADPTHEVNQVAEDSKPQQSFSAFYSEALDLLEPYISKRAKNANMTDFLTVTKDVCKRRSQQWRDMTEVSIVDPEFETPIPDKPTLTLYADKPGWAGVAKAICNLATNYNLRVVLLGLVWRPLDLAEVENHSRLVYNDESWKLPMEFLDTPVLDGGSVSRWLVEVNNDVPQVPIYGDKIMMSSPMLCHYLPNWALVIPVDATILVLFDVSRLYNVVRYAILDAASNEPVHAVSDGTREAQIVRQAIAQAVGSLSEETKRKILAWNGEDGWNEWLRIWKGSGYLAIVPRSEHLHNIEIPMSGWKNPATVCLNHIGDQGTVPDYRLFLNNDNKGENHVNSKRDGAAPAAKTKVHISAPSTRAETKLF